MQGNLAIVEVCEYLRQGSPFGTLALDVDQQFSSPGDVDGQPVQCLQVDALSLLGQLPYTHLRARGSSLLLC